MIIYFRNHPHPRASHSLVVLCDEALSGMPVKRGPGTAPCDDEIEDNATSGHVFSESNKSTWGIK